MGVLQTRKAEEVVEVAVEEGLGVREEGGLFDQKKAPDFVTSFAVGVVRVATSLEPKIVLAD